MGLGTIDATDLQSRPLSLLGKTVLVDVVVDSDVEPRYGSGTTAEISRVLVVDDDRQIRKMLEMSLRLEGIEVEAVADGASALQALERNQPDLILLDIMMPVLNGYAVMKHLREGQHARRIPVIILSAKASDEDVWEGWSCGADSYITKPLDLDMLFSEMRRVGFGRCAA